MLPIPTALLCALALTSGHARAADGPPLEPGAAVEAALPGGGGTVVHPLLTGLPTEVALCVSSFDFDAQVAVLDETGARVGAADGGGIGENAVLRVALAEGSGYRVAVSAKDERGGEYRLEAVLGEPPAPTGVEGVRAQVAYWETAAERARVRGEDQRALACRLSAGQHAQAIGWLPSARASYAEALDVVEDPGGDAAALVSLLLGSTYLELHDYRNAEAYLGVAYQGFGLGLHVHGAHTLMRLAELYVATNELARAERVGSLLVDLARAARLPDYEAEALGQLSLLAARRGRRGEALALQRAQLDVAGGLTEAAQARARYLLGRSWLRLGEEERARDELACAADLATGTGRVPALHALGSLERLRGRYWQALEHLEQARRQCEASGNELLLPTTLVELAALARSVEDLDAAEELLTRALAATASPWLASRRAQVLRELALLREDQGDAAERGRLLQQAVELASAQGLVEEEARSRISLGAALQDQAAYTAAEEEFLRAERLARAAGAQGLVSIADANLAYVDHLRGRSAAALVRAERARRRLDEHGLRLESLYALETVARAALALRDEQRATGAVELARATLVELARELDLAREIGLRSRMAWWASSLDQDLAHVRLGRATTPAERGRVARAGFRRASEWKGYALHRGLAADSTPESAPPLEHRLAKELDDETALIEYAEGSERLLAYLLHRGRLELVDVGPLEELGAESGHYVREILDPSSASSPASVLAAGQRLEAELLAPLLARAPEARRLVVVPSPSLAGLPFEALPLELGPARGTQDAWAEVTWVLDRFVVSYAPSSAVLAELAGEPPPARAARRVLVLADPDYSAAPRFGPRARARALDRLPGTRSEAAAVAELLEVDVTTHDLERRDALIQTEELTLCLGAEATPERLRQAAEYSLIHCAVHGLVDVRDPRGTGLALAFTPERPGFVSFHEVVGLELDAGLVVLSACDTARGHARGGEGVQSMAYAFFRAGARAVVANLWQVADEPTAVLMRRFYEALWSGGRAPAEALAEAKRSLVRSHRSWTASRSRGVPLVPEAGWRGTRGHPSLWAAHVYVGPP